MAAASRPRDSGHQSFQIPLTFACVVRVLYTIVLNSSHTASLYATGFLFPRLFCAHSFKPRHWERSHGQGSTARDSRVRPPACHSPAPSFLIRESPRSGERSPASSNLVLRTHSLHFVFASQWATRPPSTRRRLLRTGGRRHHRYRHMHLLLHRLPHAEGSPLRPP